jgi:3-deoxy-D-manno-octulosonic-acid transferase
MTETGQDAAESLVSDGGKAFMLPLDFPWIVRRVLDTIEPLALFVAETEIWPNLVCQSRARGIPVVLFNGRISDRSIDRYRRYRFFFKEVLRDFEAFGMQSQKDAERIAEIGASPERVLVTGNLKFDRPLIEPTKQENEAVLNSLGLTGGQVVFVAGSTHPGEEEVVLRVFQKLKRTEPNLILIIAPRHLDRLDEVTRILDTEGVRWVRKSQIATGGRGDEVILLDTMGELSRVYSIGTVIFVGKSLVPGGGHNILEPAAFGKPVMFGPHMENFREIASVMKAEGGGIEINSEEEFFSRAQGLLSDPSLYDRVSKAALRAIQKNQGALKKTFDLLEKYLERDPSIPK